MKRIYVALALAALVSIAYTPSVHAQDLAPIMARYSTENAVITNHTEHLELYFDGNELKARSRVERETLLLSDMAPTVYTNDYVYHGYFHKLGLLEGVTLVPGKKGWKTINATQYKTTRSESEDIFYDDAKQTVVTYTGLVKGARTKVTYELEHKDIHFLPSFYFQQNIPIVNGEFRLTAPKNVRIKYILKGNNVDKIKYSTSEGSNYITYTWKATDMPTLKTYDDAPGISYYMPHLLVYVTDYTTPKSNETVKVLGTVNDLYNFYYPFIHGINKTPDENLKATVATIIKGATTEREKAARIYRWVQQNIKYVAFEHGMGGFVPREAAAVCDKKYGDCKDMASLLVAMCRQAGLTAYFTWIGTRDKPYTYEETPLPIVDNHMICTVKIGNEWIFMDGTNPTIPFGIPPATLQGKEALIGISKNEYKIITVPEIAAPLNLVQDSTHITLNNRNVTGSVDILYRGYTAWSMQNIMMYQNEDEREKILKSITRRGSNKYSQTAFDYRMGDSLNRDVRLQSSFEIRDYAQQVGNEWYVNMNMQRSYESDWLSQTERKVPVEYSYKNRLTQVVVLDIPKGYKVSYLPPPQKKSINGLWGYTLTYKNTGKQVLLVKEFEFNTLMIPPARFAEHNTLVEDLKSQYKESIVLTSN